MMVARVVAGTRQCASVGWRACVAVALLVAGCRAPAAHVCEADGSMYRSVLARQIVADSALELACHPGRSGQALIADPICHLYHAGEGAIGKRIVMKCMRPPGPLASDGTETIEAEPIAVADFQAADIALFPDGSKALEALERMLGQARKRIDILMFQWDDDELGRRVAGCVAERARAGVQVRVLLDGGGNLIFGQPQKRFNVVVAELAQQPNVTALRIRDPFGRFDHRKLVVVDGQAAWSGGRNFTRDAFFHDRDVSYTLRGPLVKEMVQDFGGFWEEQGGDVSEEAESPQIAEESEPAQRAAFTALTHNAHGNARARLLHTRPNGHQIESTLYAAVDGAHHHIYLENFTLCDSLLVYKLARARQRGVDVRVVTTFSNVTPPLNRANRVTANRLLAVGVRVYIDPTMTHMKAAVVDGRWAYLGTGNFDPISLRQNYELALAVTAGPVVDQMERNVFQTDLSPERELKEPLKVNFGDYACELLASFCL